MTLNSRDRLVCGVANYLKEHVAHTYIGLFNRTIQRTHGLIAYLTYGHLFICRELFCSFHSKLSRRLNLIVELRQNLLVGVIACL